MSMRFAREEFEEAECYAILLKATKKAGLKEDADIYSEVYKAVRLKAKALVKLEALERRNAMEDHPELFPLKLRKPN